MSLEIEVLNKIKSILTNDVRLDYLKSVSIQPIAELYTLFTGSNNTPFCIINPGSDHLENIAEKSLVDTLDDIIEVYLYVGQYHNKPEICLMGDATNKGLLEIKEDIIEVLRDNKNLDGTVTLMIPDIKSNNAELPAMDSSGFAGSHCYQEIKISYKGEIEDDTFY